MIEYAVQPGTLCQVHMPGHHGGALDAAEVGQVNSTPTNTNDDDDDTVCHRSLCMRDEWGPFLLQGGEFERFGNH